LGLVELLLLGQGSFSWRSLPAVIVLAGSIGVSLVVAKAAASFTRNEFDRLQRLSASVESDFLEKVAAYTETLRGASGFFRIREDFSAAAWRDFAYASRPWTSHQALRGFGVVFPVNPEQEAGFIARMQAGRSAPFQIHAVPGAGPVPADPAGESRFVIAVVEPVERNREALGLDLASEAGRKAAAMRSRDTGNSALTDRIQLVQDTIRRPAFLLFVPVYAGPDLPDSVEARRASIQAWIYAPIVVEDMIAEVVADHQDELDLWFYEGANPKPEDLLYRPSHIGTPPEQFSRISQLMLAGKEFTLKWAWNIGKGSSRGAIDSLLPTAGFLAVVFLAGLVSSYQTFASRSRKEVEARTVDLNLLNLTLQQQNRTLLDAQARLKTNEQELAKLAMVAAYTVNAVVITDADGRIQWVNRSFTRITGYELEESRGKKPGALLQGPNTDPATIKEFSRLLAQKQGFQIVMLNHRKDGGQIWLSIEVQPVRDENGSVTSYIGLETDITEARRTTIELQRAREAAEVASRAKTTFLAHVSHELRTPLNVIIGGADLLLRGRHGTVPPIQQQALHRLKENGMLLLGLINELLDLTQAESGRLDLKLEPLDLAEKIREVAKMLEPGATERMLTLQVDLGGCSPRILGDEKRLKQVLVNLLGNALKFTPPGGQITLRMTETQVPAEVLISVSDTGPGIRKEDQERVFLEFERADLGRTAPFGTGLGLSIARRLVEAHGGSLTLQSKFGQGSTFQVRLPVRVASGN
jgi:PAS domain S-box-containing protein